MIDQFIRPNWHIILIHYPLALLSLGVLIELLSFFWRRSAVRHAGRWMLLLGALSCIPTTTLGLYAFRSVVADRVPDADLTWRQVVQQSNWSEPQWQHMTSHLWHEVIATGLVVLGSLVWLACSDRGRQRFYWVALLLLLAGWGFGGAGAWHAGEGVYRYGVAVEANSSRGAPAQGMEAPSRSPVISTASQTASGTESQPDAGDRAERTRESQANSGSINVAKETLRAVPRNLIYYVPPLQLHVLLAGMTVAIALGAFGVTLRRWAVMRQSSVVVAAEHVAVNLPEHRLKPYEHTGAPSADPLPGCAPIPQIFPARLWLWALIFALGTAASGLWVTGDWRLRTLLEPLENRFALTETQRLFGHILTGSVIALLLLFGAVLTRLARRHRPMTVLVMFILLVAFSAQIWLGVLLLFDSRMGSVARFN